MASLVTGTTVPNASKQFLELIRLIGEAKTKHEEDRIIAAEGRILQEKLKEADISPKQMKEYLVRLIYCEMLGVDASFGYIHAIKMSQSTNITEKRMGYLASSLFLTPEHNFLMLLINTLQRDIKSSNMLAVCAALTVTCKLINAEMMPAVASLVEEKLAHSKPLVRKKAVMALFKFVELDPLSITNYNPLFRKALCDPDPSVMSAALTVYVSLTAKDNAAKYKDLTSAFTNILKQVIEHRLSREYEYHGVPAPWIQIKCLKVLANLGLDDQKTSAGMYDVLADTLRRAESGTHAGYAVINECVRTIATVYPNTRCIELAAKSIARFLSSGNNNLRYLGITALTQIVQVDPKYAADHQMVVVDCLDDQDDTLKRKTLELLYKMTNPINVTFIVEKMVNYLRSTVDSYLRADLVARITQLAERYAPDNEWFITTMNAIFELGGDLVRPEVAHNLMRLIAEGSDDESADSSLRVHAVQAYLNMLDRASHRLPDICVQTMCWVLGEYTYVLGQETHPLNVAERLLSLLELGAQDETQGWILTAVMKLVAQANTTQLPQSITAAVARYCNSRSVDLQQRAFEFRQLTQEPNGVMLAMLPVDSSCEDLEPDSEISFLDSYVSAQLRAGKPAYKSKRERNAEAGVDATGTAAGGAAGGAQSSGLNFSQYPTPQQPAVSAGGGFMRQSDPSSGSGSATPAGSGVSASAAAATGLFNGLPAPSAGGASTPGAGSVSTPAAAAAAAAAAAPSATGLNVSGQRKWGKAGYAEKQATPATPTQPSSMFDTGATDATATSTPGDNLSLSSALASVGASSSTPSSGTTSQPRVTATASAPVVRELSEAEKRKKEQASMLFGGVTSQPSKTATASATTTTAAAKPVSSYTPPSASSAAAPAASAATDLLGLDDLMSAPSPTTSSAPPPSSTNALGDLNDLMSLSTATTTASASAAPAASLDIMSLYDTPASAQSPSVSLLTATPSIAFSPLTLTTPQFGAKWTTFGHETKRIIRNSSVKKVTDFMARLSSINLHPVQVIGTEGIVAGQSSDGGVVLIHGKLLAGGLEVWVRSTSAATTDEGARQCLNALQ